VKLRRRQLLRFSGAVLLLILLSLTLVHGFFTDGLPHTDAKDRVPAELKH
jgi:hypothetical protein